MSETNTRSAGAPSQAEHFDVVPKRLDTPEWQHTQD